MVADRIDCYRLEGLLGTGGMGEVYRGWDERLDRPVAIKLIRADRALGKAERQRLLREARALAKLSHPAIVQIYYFLEWEGRGCFIMELVEGRTLAELLRQGRLELAGALRLGHEIAGALAAAHAKGIVHRDLKTQNVMVTPDGHAKVLDFGLARLLASDEIPVTTEGIVVGTPHVMAPEQVQGEGVDHRADLFSFGALLYEMLTARTPFRGATQQETLARVVMYSQPPARMLNPAIPAELSECIDRLLEKDPARRPQSAVEVVAVLDGLIGGLPTAPTEVRLDPDQSTVILTKGDETIAPPDDIRPNPRAMLWIMAVVALLAVGTYFGYRLWTPAPEPVETPNPVAVQQPGVVLRPSAAVLSFHSRTGRTDADWLATALAELLRSYVAAGDEIRIVRGNRVATVERDLAPGALATLTPEERSLLRRNLGVDRLIGGTFEIMGDGTDPLLRIALQVEDPATGQVRTLDPKTGVAHPLPQLIRLAGEPLRPELGAAALTSAQWLAVEASFPSEQEAARLYAQALARLRRDDSLAARDLLGEAVAAEPDHPLLHAALAEAWLDLGYYDDAAEAAQKAFTLVGELPPAQRLTVEALRHEANGDEDRAIAVYRSVFEASPDDFDAGLRLAEVQIDLQWADEVLATLNELKKLPAAAGNPRLALTRARAWEISGDSKKTRTSAERAAQQAELRGANLLAAEARRTAAGALLDLGEKEAAAAAINEAIGRFRTGDDRRALAAAYELKAEIVYELGDLDGARRLYGSALEIYRRMGRNIEENRVATNLGTLLLEQGNSGDAKVLFDQTLAVYDQTGNRYGKAAALVSLGALYQELGQITEARTRYIAALGLLQELRDKVNTALVLTNIGELLFLGADLDDARRMHEEALATNRLIPDPSGAAYDTHRLGMVFAAQGDYVVARQRYEEALSARERLGEADGAAETRLALAALSILEGDSVASEELAREAAEVLRVAGIEDQAAMAQTVLARALAGQGKLAEARECAAQANRRAEQSEDRRLRFAAAIVTARLQAASGQAEDIDSALETLAAIAAEGAAAGLVLDAFEARLARGEIELAAGRPGARERLEALAAEAARKGVRQVVRRVAEILTGPAD